MRLLPLPHRAARPFLTVITLAVFAGVSYAGDDDAPPTTPQPQVNIVQEAHPHATTQPANTTPPENLITHAEVEQVIRKAVAYIYSQQNRAGNWDVDSGSANNPGDVHFGGKTAIAVYALLAAGEPRTGAKLKPAIDWLKRAEINGTYAVAMRLNALAYLPQETVAQNVRADCQALVKGVSPAGSEAAGRYDYSLKQGERDETRFDHSCSQMGVLGVWVASQMGAPAPGTYWNMVEKAWKEDQQWSGGWCYGRVPSGDFPVAGAITAAGVATLYITQEFLHADAGAACRGNVTSPEIGEGLKWLEQHFTAESNPGDKGSHDAPQYWLYAAERVGAAGGVKYFGQHDWFAEGARVMRKIQRADGALIDPERNNLEDLPATCFGVLFLARGRQPVLVNKLRYDGSWNQRPRDAANLVRWAGRTMEREFHWQVVGIENDVREFHDAPVLLVTGGEDLAFSAEERQKLKRYVEQGGLILGNADCANPTFVKAFQRLGLSMFPAYKWRVLPDDHPIQTEYVRTSKPVQVWGLSNGVRELMLLLPDQDPGKTWQLNRPKAEPSHFEVAANILLYASDQLLLRYKLDPFLPERIDANPAARTVHVARLKYSGNWDPEPGGWPRLAVEVYNRNAVQITPAAVPLGEGKLAGAAAGGMKFPVAHLTGTAALKLEPKQLEELQKFIDGGGTLLIDAAGGSTEFANFVQTELIPGITKEPIGWVPADDPIFGAPAAVLPAPPPPATTDVPFPVPTAAPAPVAQSSTGPAAAAPARPLKVDYRRFAKKRLGSLKELRLKGVRVNGRWAILFSDLDLSAGLVGQNIDGIVGYLPESATTLVSRIVLNASTGR